MLQKEVKTEFLKRALSEIDVPETRTEVASGCAHYLSMAGKSRGAIEIVDTIIKPAQSEQRLIGRWVRHNMENYSGPSDVLVSICFFAKSKVEWTIDFHNYGGVKTRKGTCRVETSGSIIWPQSKGLVIRIQPEQDDPAIFTSALFREDGTPVLLFNVKVGKGIDNRFSTGTELLKFRHGLTEYFFTKERTTNK